MEALTLDDIKAMDRDTITPRVVADVLHCTDQKIRMKARAGLLEFPCVLSGNIVIIPRLPFIKFMEGT